jgi:hypothetical protein
MIQVEENSGKGSDGISWEGGKQLKSAQHLSLLSAALKWPLDVDKVSARIQLYFCPFPYLKS